MERAAGSETAALAAHTKNAVQKQTETHGDPIHNFNVTTKKHSYHARADGLPSMSGDQEHRDAWSRQLRNKHHIFYEKTPWCEQSKQHSCTTKQPQKTNKYP